MNSMVLEDWHGTLAFYIDAFFVLLINASRYSHQQFMLTPRSALEACNAIKTSQPV